MCINHNPSMPSSYRLQDIKKYKQIRKTDLTTKPRLLENIIIKPKVT